MSESCPQSFVEALRQHGVTEPIPLAIVLGTGLVRLSEDLEDRISIPYGKLPGFPHVTVSGHAGRLSTGRLGGQRVALLEGRAHFYETGDPQAMRAPIEGLKAAGTNTLVLTNAAGSLRADWSPGRLALISDHINFSGVNPLLREVGDERFVSLVDAYDPRLRLRMKRSAERAGVQLHEGVYMWFSGPSFETPAEIRMAKSFGADLVGMSTVPEVILARRIGLDVAAISVITNLGAGISGSRPSHGETKTVAISGSIALRRLLAQFARSLEEK